MRAVVALAMLAACGRCEDARSTTTLVLDITDEKQPVGARVLLWDANGEPVRIGTLDLYGQRQGSTACRIAPGALGSWNGLIVARGIAEIPIGHDACAPSPAIPYGKYKVWAWRGIEYEKWEGEVDLSANRGRVALAIPLVRAWTPHGTLAADLHVHAQASNDSTLPNQQRVIAQAAAGIQVIGLSDHNANGDVDLEIGQLGLADVIASIAGNELTAEQLHVNVYPVVVDKNQPRGGSPQDLAKADAAKLFATARAMPGNPIVQLNHPRFRYTALYDGTRWDGVAWPPPFSIDFDAVEVLAGYSAFNMPGDRRFDESVRDLFTFMDHGKLLIPVGNSDTHDLNWVLDGTARTYVFVDDPRTRPFDEAAFIAALRARRVVATTGPWLDVEVGVTSQQSGPGQSLRASGKVPVDIELSQAAFVNAERITIHVGGKPAVTFGPGTTAPGYTPGARVTRLRTEIDVGSDDTWIAVTADGDTPMPKEITGTYQQDKWQRPGVTPFAIAAPILIDADGDGRWKRGGADLLLGDALRK